MLQEEEPHGLIEETDYGTPASKAAETVTLTIDGKSATVPAGTSIMRAAMEIGTEIPKLCATDMLDAFGSCRICLVEIEGRAGTPALRKYFWAITSDATWLQPLGISTASL